MKNEEDNSLKRTDNSHETTQKNLVRDVSELLTELIRACYMDVKNSGGNLTFRKIRVLLKSR